MIPGILYRRRVIYGILMWMSWPEYVYQKITLKQLLRKNDQADEICRNND